MNKEMAGIILAGGRATRMGGACDKAFLKIYDETIIGRQLDVFRKIFTEIIVVTNSINNYTTLSGVKAVSDIFPGRGPLGGIYSGLLNSSSFYNFVIACDMPFINEPLIRHMTGIGDGYDVVIPETDDRFHPLFGVYSKNCVSVIEEAIGRGDLRVKDIFSKVNSRILKKQEIQEFDEHLFSLININTKEDLLMAEGMREAAVC